MPAETIHVTTTNATIPNEAEKPAAEPAAGVAAEPTREDAGDAAPEMGQAAGSTAARPARDRERSGRRPKKQKRSLFVRLEAFVSRLSTRNTFWHRVCSLIWLPYAFHSGIKMKRLDGQTFQAVLPFRRFNRNWYNAMAGAALLGNSEIAGGTYVFGFCGSDYTVVCKHLEYKFLRPCLGPAIYKITPKDDIEAQVASGEEFNAVLQMDIYQAITKPGAKERRVGRCTATFHITPKTQQRSKGRLK